ncbi:uncharacterized protein [Lolium perenne]|uniref:uncharacterized protein n=1 Tax=Lolium perenne TaxID=4522 RepID=UPI0021EA1C4C|nr:uncharacterized protein LOC127294623 [Lolium perenne]
MAPKRKSPAAAAAPAMPSRITRSMAAGKQAADAPPKKEEAEAVPVPPAAPAGQKGRKKAKKEEVVEEVEAVLSPPPAAKGKGKGRKNAKKEVAPAPAPAPAPAKEEEEEAEEEVDDSPFVEDGKRVVVEACTQCQQFKKRAVKVKEDLESAVPGVSVTINPEKPRRGCLEIREEGGEVFLSLRDMKRPFNPMRELDMDKVIHDIVKKIS